VQCGVRGGDRREFFYSKSWVEIKIEGAEECCDASMAIDDGAEANFHKCGWVCGACHLPRPCSGPVINAQLWRFRRCNLISEEASVVVGAFSVGKPRLSKST
jgi:hypothetical protein